MSLDPIQIAELVLSATAGGVISRIFTIRPRVKQENARADADNIENIRKIVDEIYQPTISSLKTQVAELREEVRIVREENEQLKDENDKLRDAIREINPEAVPSKRSVNATNQPRAKSGRFVKKEEC